MRYAMLNEHRDLIGPTRAFDGSILYLPKKVTDTVSYFLSFEEYFNFVLYQTIFRTSKRVTDGTDVQLSITLTNILSYKDCTQLFNIIIRRVLKALDLQQVGRHYFDKRHPIQVPQHKYVFCRLANTWVGVSCNVSWISIWITFSPLF